MDASTGIVKGDKPRHKERLSALSSLQSRQERMTEDKTLQIYEKKLTNLHVLLRQIGKNVFQMQGWGGVFKTRLYKKT